MCYGVGNHHRYGMDGHLELPSGCFDTHIPMTVKCSNCGTFLSSNLTQDGLEAWKLIEKVREYRKASESTDIESFFRSLSTSFLSPSELSTLLEWLKEDCNRASTK